MIRERGSATLEIALTLPLVLILLLTIAEIAVVARTQLELINSAREGARIAAVSPDPADAVAATKGALGELGDAARISVVRPGVVGEPAVVAVALRHRLVPYLFGGAPIQLRARVTMRVER